MKSTPRKSIVRFCKECTSGNVDLCSSPKCQFFPFKRNITLPNAPKAITRVIKDYCLMCVGYDKEEVKHCTGRDCPVYPYRMGKNTNRVGASAEHMKAISGRTQFSKNHGGESAVLAHSFNDHNQTRH